MKFGSIVTLALLLLVLLIHAASATPETPHRQPLRVAVISTSKDPRVQRISDVVEAELGESGTIQLIERQNVDRLLAEQHLSLSGLVDANYAVSAGRILAADLLAILESEAQTSAGGLIVLDLRTGARLCDAAITMDADDRAAKSVVQAVVASAAKYEVPANLHTLCLMTVRNADLPREMDGFCDAVGRLLERMLAGGPSVVVLERSRLEQVNKERVLAADAGSNQLFASLVVVEVDIARGAGGHGLRATALLSDNAGRNLCKLTAVSKEQDVLELADALASEVQTNLKLAPTAAVDRQVEGKRFLAEANVRCGSSDFVRGVIAAESAHALIPDDLGIHAVLARAMASKGFHSLSDDHRKATLSQDAARSAQMLSDLLARASRADRPTQGAVLTQLSAAERQLLDYIRFYCALGGPVKQINAVRNPLRQYHHDKEDFDVSLVKDESSFIAHLLRQYGFVWVPANVAYCADSEQWTTDLLRYSKTWLTLHRQYPNASLSIDPAYALARSWLGGPRDRLAKGLRFRPHLEPTALDYARLREIQREMNADPDIRISGWGDLCGLCIDACQARPSAEKVKSLVDNFVSAHMQLLRQDDLRDMEIRKTLYFQIDEADGLLDGTPWQGQHSRMLLNFTLDRHEMVGNVVRRGVRQGFWFDEKLTPEQEAEKLSLANRAYELLVTPDCKRVKSPVYFDDRFRAELDRLRRPPDPLFATTRPWQNSVELVDFFAGEEAVVHPLVRDQSVYALHESEGEAGRLRLTLLCIPLVGGKAETLSTIDPPASHLARMQSTYRSGSTSAFELPAACMSETTYCVGTKTQGIFLFPLAGGPVQHIAEAQGFPSQWVQAVAILDGTLYAGLGSQGNSYIASCNLATDQTDILASNSRKEKQSPFDDGSAFAIRGLYADAPRHRIIAAVHRFEPKLQANGLWEYVPATRKWRMLLPFAIQDVVGHPIAAPIVDGIQSFGYAHDEQLPLLNVSGILLFDLRTDSARLTFPRDPSRQPQELPLIKGVTGAGQMAWGLTRRDGVATLDFPWIWTNFSDFRWGRINLTTGRNEYFPPLRHGNDNERFLPTTIMPLDGDSNFLVSDDRGIWLLSGAKR